MILEDYHELVGLDYTDYDLSRGDLPLNPFSYPIVKNVNRVVIPWLFPGVRFLEFGCGQAKKFRELVRLNDGHYACMDKDPKSMSTYLELPESSFDLVASIDVLEHLSISELNNFLDWSKDRVSVHIHETSNPFSPNGVGGFFGDATHKQLYNSRMLGGLFKSHGFTKVNFFRVYAGRTFLRDRLAKFLGFDICSNYVIVAKKPVGRKDFEN